VSTHVSVYVQRSSIQHLWIPGRFPGLNELLAARGQRDRVTGWVGYNDIKKQWQHRVVLLARAQHLVPVESAYFTYLIYEPNKKRDPSNVSMGVIKIIEDALQKAEVIPNDGWKAVLGFQAHWEVDLKSPGCAVFLSKHNTLDKPTAFYRDQEIRCPRTTEKLSP